MIWRYGENLNGWCLGGHVEFTRDHATHVSGLTVHRCSIYVQCTEHVGWSALLIPVVQPMDDAQVCSSFEKTQ